MFEKTHFQWKGSPISLIMNWKLLSVLSDLEEAQYDAYKTP